MSRRPGSGLDRRHGADGEVDVARDARSFGIRHRRLDCSTVAVRSSYVDRRTWNGEAERFFAKPVPHRRGSVWPGQKGETTVQPRRHPASEQRPFDCNRPRTAHRIEKRRTPRPVATEQHRRRERLAKRRLRDCLTIAALMKEWTGAIGTHREHIVHDAYDEELRPRRGEIVILIRTRRLDCAGRA